MPTVASLTGASILGPKGKRIGWVTHVLFHPSEQRVVGIEMRPRPVGYMIERSPRYYAYDAFEIADEKLTLIDAKGSSGTAAAKRLGIDWEQTVIWAFQDVKTKKGREMGQVANVTFAKDGTVRAIKVSGGMTANVAVGQHTIPAEEILGFDGDSIRVTDASNEAATSGGVAAQAGKGAAIASHTAKKAASGALTAGVAAAKAASKSETAKRAKEGWSDFTSAFKEGLRGDEK